MKFIVLLAVLFAVTSVVLANRGKNNQAKQKKGGKGGGNGGAGKKAAVKAKEGALGKNKKSKMFASEDDEDYPEYDSDEEEYFSGPEFKRGGGRGRGGSDSYSWEDYYDYMGDYDDEDMCFHQDEDPREMAGYFFSRVIVVYMPMPGGYGGGGYQSQYQDYPQPMPGFPGPPMPRFPGHPMRGFPMPQMPDSFYPMESEPGVSSVDFTSQDSGKEEYNPEADKKMVIKSGRVKAAKKAIIITTTTKKRGKITTTTYKPTKKNQARRNIG